MYHVHKLVNPTTQGSMYLGILKAPNVTVVYGFKTMKELEAWADEACILHGCDQSFTSLLVDPYQKIAPEIEKQPLTILNHSHAK